MISLKAPEPGTSILGQVFPTVRLINVRIAATAPETVFA
jgi:hypothetical protein